MVEEYEDSCFSFFYIIRFEFWIVEEKNLKFCYYKFVIFRFFDFNFGIEVSGNFWILKFDVFVCIEFYDGFRNVCIGMLMIDEIYVGYNLFEEVVVR